MVSYAHVAMFIDGEWIEAPGERIINPATEEVIGHVPHATVAHLDRALEAAGRAFMIWRNTAPAQRAAVIMEAVRLLRERTPAIAAVITKEQGKPLADARDEVLRGADLIAWDAEEARRAYGRVIPSAPRLHQRVVREPIGPVAAFTPWSAPSSSAARKIGAALAAGCSVILKASEETPAGACALVKCFEDAGLPRGALNLVFGVPADISRHLIASPITRLVTFTGSVPVGIHLAQLAAARMKPALMELGGHSPVIVCRDADPVHAARLAVRAKYRNSGQVCISPTRFYVHHSLYDAFTEEFCRGANALKVGNGMDDGVQMGPVANARRLSAIMGMIADAKARGATVLAGGSRIGNRGYFIQPTAIAGVPADSLAMTSEPFGPIALMQPFHELDDAIEAANSLPYGLAAYAFTDAASNASLLADRLAAGHVAINHFGGGVPESPFGGVKESGLGREGGMESLDAYHITKFVTHCVRPV